MSVSESSTSGAQGVTDPAERAPRVLGCLTRLDIAMIVLLSAGIFAIFYRWFIQQFGPGGFSVRRFEDWGHAYFVPVVGAFYIWKNRAALAKLEVKPYWPALSILPIAVMAYLSGILLYRNHMFQGFALILAIAGTVLLVAGPVVLRALSFPIGYLLFAVTISEMVMNAITWQLKIIASKGSYIMLNMVGVETDIKGNILYISQGVTVHPLNVADACSGMRMVVAFIALGAAVAFLASTEWWKRIAILVVSLPIAIFMNIVRVAALGILTLIDPALADGEAHTLIGTILLVPAFLLFLGIVAMFDKLTVSDELSTPVKKKTQKLKAKPAGGKS